MSDGESPEGTVDFEGIVNRYYRSLFRFGVSLNHSEAEAADLVQQTFLAWADKGHQLRDPSKVKTWLFTTLHREFLKSRRRQSRFPHEEYRDDEEMAPPVSGEAAERLDAESVLKALQELDESHRAPLALFYLEDHSYKEIAEILEIPMGTVQSRIARGKDRLHRILSDRERVRSR